MMPSRTRLTSRPAGRRRLRWPAVALALLGMSIASTPQNVGSPALLLELKGVIGPASMDFVVRGIDRAQAEGAPFVILRIDTPGGLDSSMRGMISHILASEVPIVTYVAPSGARAASAGTYIAYASHVVAMAPATNLGSATPVQIVPGAMGDRGPDSEDGGTDEDVSEEKSTPGTAMERKIINDAVAYITGLARLHGRNETWAEQAVRLGANLPAEDALEKGVIDLMATDVEELIEKIDGRTVRMHDRTLTLATTGVSVLTLTPDWRTRLLGVITNPNIAYILMLLGIYGLFFELSNPGAIVPGVLGGICLLLALYAFQVLPVNYAGVALILLGIAFMVAELFVPSFGALGIGGGVAFVFGSVILMDTPIDAFSISLPLIVAVAIMTAVFVFTLISLAIRQRKRPVVSGSEEMIGSEGSALVDFTGEGRIHVHGEQWAARCDRPVRAGQSVRVVALDGLTLVIEPMEKTA